MSHPALDSQESRACVEALYEANPDGTAELMLAFPEAVFSWCKGEAQVEGPACAAAQRGSKQVEGYRQGRLI